MSSEVVDTTVVSSQVVDEEVKVVESVVLDEVVERESFGKYTGSTKWFNDKLGYGFITICDGDEKGKDIFVHHSGIKPLNSNYKTLRKGEYIQFNIINGMNGLQAVDVTGIKGGPLMCDYVTSKRVVPLVPSGPPPVGYHVQGRMPHEVGEWQSVPVRKPRMSVGPPMGNPMGPPASVPKGGRKPMQKNVAKYNKATRKSPAPM